MLLGHEVKSVKTGHISLKGSFVTIRSNEVYLLNATIPKYKFAGNILSYEPTRTRKLLLKKSQIKSLIGKKQAEGLTLVPIKVYDKNGKLKIQFGVGRGKKQFDKRQSISKRESNVRLKRTMHARNQ